MDMGEKFRRLLRQEMGEPKKKEKKPVYDFKTELIGGDDIPKEILDEVNEKIQGVLRKYSDKVKGDLYRAALVAVVHNKVTWFEGENCKVGAFSIFCDDGEDRRAVILIMGNYEEGSTNVLPYQFAKRYKLQADDPPALEELMKQACAHLQKKS